jgi:hypothetical protein
MSERGAAGHWRVPALLLCVAATSFLLYNAASPSIANVAIFPYAASLVLGPSLVYAWLRRDGASIRAAVCAALVLPFLWLVKEGYRVTAVFSVGEAVYYAFNPLSLGLFTAAAFQMASAELLLRRARRGRWELATGPALTLLAIVSAVAVFAILARESGGREVFYAYITLYRHLFGEG